jgi:hypothetical protein
VKGANVGPLVPNKNKHRGFLPGSRFRLWDGWTECRVVIDQSRDRFRYA